MSVTESKSDSVTPRRLLDAKGWVAIAGLAFGMSQFVMSIYFSQKNAALDRALDEEASYRVTADFLYFNNRALGSLIEHLEGAGSTGDHTPDVLRVSVVELAEDAADEESGRPAGWQAFRVVHARSLEDPPKLRDQVYTFLRLKSRGTAFIDTVHVRFADGASAVARLEGGSVVLVPIRLGGRHANLARGKGRMPERAWYVYERLGRTKSSEIDIQALDDQLLTGFPGVVQTRPEFLVAEPVR